MANGDEKVLDYDYLLQQVTYYNSLGDEASEAAEKLKLFLPNLQHNASQLSVVKGSLSGAPDAASTISDCAVEGEKNFLQGAMYCGQEVGGSEAFANIKTKVDALKEIVSVQETAVDNAISAYETAINAVTTEIGKLKKKAENYYAVAQSYRSKMNAG